MYRHVLYSQLARARTRQVSSGEWINTPWSVHTTETPSAQKWANDRWRQYWQMASGFCEIEKNQTCKGCMLSDILEMQNHRDRKQMIGCRAGGEGCQRTWRGFLYAWCSPVSWLWWWLRDSVCLSKLRTWRRRRQWQPTPGFLPGESRGWRGLVGYSPWGRWESGTTEQLHFHFSLSCIGEGNGKPLQCSCLENSRDGGAWWAAIYGVTQSRTQLKWLSSSSSSSSSSSWC